ncbi:MAG: hypothetical protein J7L50_01320 [Candidatus Odinarchaeota archaeon]|nr:hypothetical protein [Candidatus Odinarchaeota archaeon]
MYDYGEKFVHYAKLGVALFLIIIVSTLWYRETFSRSFIESVVIISILFGGIFITFGGLLLFGEEKKYRDSIPPPILTRTGTKFLITGTILAVFGFLTSLILSI